LKKVAKVGLFSVKLIRFVDHIYFVFCSSLTPSVVTRAK
jgi:hypothetical protein